MSDPSKAVFLSYASQDVEAALRIADALRAAGVEVWFDQNELVGGEAWDAKIRKQISECALFVPIISANTQARGEGYFRIEWRVAAQRTHAMADDETFLLPVVIDATRDAEARVPAEFKSVQWMRLSGGENSGKFCRRVQGLLAGESVAAPGERPVSAGQAGSGTRAMMRRRFPAAGWILGSIAVLAVAATILWPKRDHPPAPSRNATVAGKSPDSIVERVRGMLRKTNVLRSELELAANLLQQAAKENPTDAEVIAEQAMVDGRFLSERYDVSDARRDLARRHATQAEALDPASPAVRLARAVTAYRLDPGNPAVRKDAAQILQSLLPETPSDPRPLHELGQIALLSGKTAEARERFAEAGRLPGQAGLAAFNIAMAWVQERDYRAALTALDEALAAERAVKFLLWRAFLQAIWLGDPAGAKQILNEVPAAFFLEDYPANTRFLVGILARDFEQALAAMTVLPRDFIESPASRSPTAYGRGFALSLLGRPAAAKVEWNSALGVVEQRLAGRPQDLDLLRCKVVLLAWLERRSEAVTQCAILRQFVPDSDPRNGFEEDIAVQLLMPEAVVDRLENFLQSGKTLFPAAYYRLHPRYDHLRTHPRFASLVERLEADPRFSPTAAALAPPLSPSSSPAPPASSLTPPGPVADSKSVAVLAFANLSDEKANEYFSDGISEELLNVLGRVPGLRVAAPMSAFSFKGRNVPAQEIGQKLNVAYLVSGSVRWSGSAIRVVARLSRAATDEQIWTDKFDGEAKNVFALQDEIAAKIAAALSLKLGASGRGAQRIDPEAYRLYLEARHFWSLRTFGGFDRAEAALKQAVAREPASALLRAGLAEVYATRGWYRAQNAADPGDNYALAEAEADRAVALDPDNAQAIVAQATIAIAQRRFAEAERCLRRALSLAPNDAAAFDRLGDLMVRTGRLDAAVENYLRAMQLDPLSVYLVRDVVRELTYARRFQDVIETVDRYEASAPRDWRTIAWRSQALIHFGKTEQAARELKGILPAITPDEFSSSGASIAELVFSLRQARCAPESEALARQLLERHRPGTYLHAMVLVALGRTEEALPQLVAFPTGTEDRLYWSAVFDPLREDPRFLRKIEEFGVATEYKVARETLARIVTDRAAKQ